MTTLVACLSTGKGTWSSLLRLIDAAEWEKIVLVTNAFGKEKFNCNKPFELVVLNFDYDVEQLAADMKKGIEGKIVGFEVALNMESGTGKEHMALLSALQKLGLGIRMVTFKDGVKEV
jgi:hypothetical protein